MENFAGYGIHLGILIGIYILLAQSFNLTFGLGLLFNLAHIAAYAIGAYTTAILSTQHDYDFFLCILSSATLSGFFALLIGAIALRLSTDYFAIGTLAFSSVVTAVLINWKDLTRGVLGIPGIPRPEILGYDFSDNASFLYLISAAVLISLIILYFIFNSALARSLSAQAENKYACYALGKDVTKIRNSAFITSSMFAGLAGSFFAYYINYIDPSSFDLKEMIFVLSIVIVGKPGSFWGVIAATFFLVLLPEGLRFYELPPEFIGPMRQLLYAAILFVVVYWKRAVLFPRQRTV